MVLRQRVHQAPDRLTQPLLAIRVDLLSLVEQGTHVIDTATLVRGSSWRKQASAITWSRRALIMWSACRARPRAMLDRACSA
jgi:hypothetical protein